MKKYSIEYEKSKLWYWAIIFFAGYGLFFKIYTWIYTWFLFDMGLIVVQIVFLYLFSIAFMKIHLHRIVYEIEDDHLIVKEFLSNKEKYVMIIPFSHILAIEEDDIHEYSYYHKVKKLKKRYTKDTKLYYIEYDDYMDVSLLKVQCHPIFIEEVRKYIGLCKS